MKQQLLFLTLPFILLTVNAPMGEAPPNDVLKLISPGNPLALLSSFRNKGITEDMDQNKNHRGVFAIIHSAGHSSRKLLQENRDVSGAEVSV